MIEFVYGSHGTGKTEYIFECLKKDAEAGIRSFLIVPEQAAVTAERRALAQLPPSAQLTFEVLNFSRMSNRIFREYGGLSYTVLTPGMKKVLMMRALRQTSHLMSVYGEPAMSDRGFPDVMLRTVKELKNCGVGLTELEKISESASSSLSSKLKDILLCASVYEELKGNAGDADSEGEKLADCLEKHGFFRGSHVYIDSFSGFTGVQHRIIRSVFAQADRTVVSVPLPSPDFRGTDTVSLRKMSDRLRSDAAACGAKNSTRILSEIKRTSMADLGLVSEKLWESPISESGRDGSVTGIITDGIFDEAEFAAGLAKALVEDGRRCGDIMLVSRNPAAYKGIIDAAFEDAGIPFWISDKQLLSLTSPARLVLSALKILDFGWRREDVTSHLRTGLCGIDDNDIDIFAAYTDKWNLTGKSLYSDKYLLNPSGYNAEWKPEDTRRLEIADGVRAGLCDSVGLLGEELNSAADCKGMCRAIFSYTEKLGVGDRLLAEAALALENGRRAEADELARTYTAFTKALSELAAAYKDAEKPSLREFTEALSAILESSEIGSIPQSSDTVTMASADILRADNPACVFLLGVADGSFPAAPAEHGLLNEEDRLELSSDARLLFTDSTQAASDELYYFRRACAQATEKLFVFRGKDRSSIPYARIKNMLPELVEIKTSEAPEIRLSSEKVAADWLPLLNGTDAGAVVGELLGRDPDEALPPDISAKKAFLSSDTANISFGRDMLLSQSQLELFLNCPFAYACSKHLGLADSDPAEFSYRHIGTYIHAVLERYLKIVFRDRAGILPEEAEEKLILQSISGRIIDEIAPPGTPGRTGLVSHITDRLSLIARIISHDAVCEISGSDFMPEFFELEIKPGALPPLAFYTEDGSRVSFIGKVDRLDICRRDGKAYIKAVDYKTGSQEFKLDDIKDGKKLQLILYLMSLTQYSNSGIFGGEPTVAAFEYVDCKTERLDAFPADEAEAIALTAEKITRTGAIIDTCEMMLNSDADSKNHKRFTMITQKRETVLTQDGFDEIRSAVSDILVDAAERMKRGDARAMPRDGGKSCEYCRFSSVCRSKATNKYNSDTED